MDVGLVLALWLHTLGFVTVMGYYGVLGRIVIPAIERSLDGSAQATALKAIERRAMPLVLLSVVLFAITGAYLLVVDAKFEGLGSFFASTWTTLMLVKHLVVIVLVALGVAVDVLIRRLSLAASKPDRRSDLLRIELAAEGATGLGALVVLLTAAAQLA
jgi:uncharacterized membrane protein